MTFPVREMQVNGIASVSTEELSGLLGKPGLLLVDVRESAAYNGWRLAGEGRGGHIPGAVNLPLSWVGDLEGSDFRALLESKGVDLNTAIVVYGANRDDSEKMAQTLGETGCREVLVYQNGLAAWAADVARPMARLANYEKLVHPKWVYDLVHGKHPATYPAKAFVVFEVGWQVRKEYSQGHIPGAVYLDTNEIEAEL